MDNQPRKTGVVISIFMACMLIGLFALMQLAQMEDNQTAAQRQKIGAAK